MPGLSIKQTSGTAYAALLVRLYDLISYEEEAECAEVLFAIVLRAFRH
jgi:hypothetical protein